MQMMAYFVLVKVILHAGSHRFPLFILTSVMAWKFFTTGVLRSMTTTLSKEASMRQVAFPKIVLPISAVLSETALFAFGVAFIMVAAVFWHRYTSNETPFLLLVIPVQLVFTLAIGVLLAALNFFLRDMLNFVAYMFPLWFYLSPGLYNIDRVPEKWMNIYLLNPFATILPAYHAILLDHAAPNFERLAIW